MKRLVLTAYHRANHARLYLASRRSHKQWVAAGNIERRKRCTPPTLNDIQVIVITAFILGTAFTTAVYGIVHWFGMN
jgi:hypothetical protein